MRVLLVPLALVLPSLCLAQSTCFTDPHGTTICSSPGTVVHGNTDSTGHSLYRDDRGNRLDFETDRSGKAVLTLPSGESINWSQRVLGEKKYPFSHATPQAPPTPPAGPAGLSPSPPATTQGQP